MDIANVSAFTVHRPATNVQPSVIKGYMVPFFSPPHSGVMENIITALNLQTGNVCFSEKSTTCFYSTQIIDQGGWWVCKV